MGSTQSTWESVVEARQHTTPHLIMFWLLVLAVLPLLCPAAVVYNGNSEEISEYINAEQAAEEDCECVDITVLDENSGKHIGNCLTQFNDKFWCYVTSTSPCSDKNDSARARGLYYSQIACQGKFLKQPQPKIEVNY